ncbi:hypothetical protein CRE_27751 [Caenorhabditis remanei]|uniref:RNA-directed DNA polymerase n=1 Tax=Caenorhabditis remanei TaxID=31234 RepID=E3MXR3_CAERE|nr:hypothetical protein CRE_27751 [Caenorhabditis remanei]
MGEEKLAFAKELTETLRMFREQMVASAEIQQNQLAENRRLHEEIAARAAAGSETETLENMTVQTPRARNNARLMGDLARRLPRFVFTLDEPYSFKKWFSRHELVIVEDGKDLSSREQVRLLLGALDESAFHRYVDSQREAANVYDIPFKDTVEALGRVFGSHRSLMMKRQECLQITRASGMFHDPLEYSNRISEAVLDSKLATMSTDDWSVFLFLRGLDGPGDAAAKAFLMQWAEQCERKKEKVTLALIHDEWLRFLQLKQQTKTVAASSPKQPLSVNKVEKKPVRNTSNHKTETKGHGSESQSKKEFTCFKCGEQGHCAPQCPQNSGKKNTVKRWEKKGAKKTQSVRVDNLDGNQSKSVKPSMWVNVGSQMLKFQLDTGSEITLISEKSWKAIGAPELEEVPHRIACANGTEMIVKGRVLVSFELKGVQYSEYAYVRQEFTNLIGMSWLAHSPEVIEALDVVVSSVTTAVAEKDSNRLRMSLQTEFPKVFEDTLGLCTKEKALVRTLPNVNPTFKKCRPVPYGSEKPVEAELKRLEDMGVIEHISHSDWASPIVVVRKRIRGKCEYVLTSKVPLKGKIFSQIDLKDAYLQIELDSEAQKLAVINTHLGLFKYKRMPFGLKPAPAIFQKVVDKLTNGLPGVASYLDDIIVSAETMHEHEHILKLLFARFEEYGLKVSLEKCAFAKSEIKFLGFIVNGNGRKPDPQKTEVIRGMESPKNQKQLASFLGAICFYSRFVPKLSDLRGPLDRLMKQDVDWKWTNIEQNAFDRLKNSVADATMLSHFKEDWKIVIAADASQYGIGGVLSHINPEGQELPIAHFARSLTETEKRYSQIEKEGLALVYTVKKCHKFVFGRKFSLQTDHKPLLAIFGDNKDLPVHSQNRLVRWAITLLSYNFDISYVSTAKFAKADWLSRMIQNYPRDENDVVIAEIRNEDDFEDEFPKAELYPVTAEDIKAASETDPEVSTVMKLVRHDSWKPKPHSDVEKYWHRYKDRLKILQHCLLLDDRVVVPRKLQNAVLSLLHEGHPGIIKMKQKARAFVFWRGLDREVERMVQHCSRCQEQSKMPIVAPLNPWPAPEKPWIRIHVDYAGPVDGNYLLVVVDGLSKYAEVKMTKSISAVSTVDLMEEVFCIHGFPKLIMSDNGSQFTSALFKNMCKNPNEQRTWSGTSLTSSIHQKGATVLKIKAGHPALITQRGIFCSFSPSETTETNKQRRRMGSRMFQNDKKRADSLTKLKGTGSITKQLLSRFLFYYRNTPHAALNGRTPAEIHFNRTIRTTMSLLLPRAENHQKAALSNYQAKMKHQYDTHNAARAKFFQVDQKVYARVQRGNKSEWGLGVVRRRYGNVLYEVQIGDRLHRCHVNQLRQRVGDKSKEDVFEETIFPLFFGNTQGDRVETQQSGGLRGHRVGLNVSDIPDTTRLPFSSDSDFLFGGGTRVDSGSSGQSLAQSEVNYELNVSRDYDRRAQDSLPISTSATATTTTSTAISPLPDTSPQARPTADPNHSLRRSQRPRRAPNRYDPCSEPQHGIRNARGSSRPDHPAARARGIAPASARRGQHNSSARGGGNVGKARGRPRWQ